MDARLVRPPEPGRNLAAPWRQLTFPVRLGTLLASGAALRGSDVDIVHAHYAWKAVAALPARRPFVIHCHGTDVRDVPPHSARGLLLAGLLPRARRVYLATPDLGRWVLPLAPSATFLPNPVDVSLFRPGSIPATRDLLIGLRLDPIKGLDAIVEALAAVIQARPRTSVSIVAHGPGVAAAMQVAGEQAHLVPPMPRKNLPAFYGQHRVAIGQSLVGAIGNYELEALACGVPVAASFRFADAYDVPPPLIPFDDPQATAEAIVEILDDEPRRLGLAQTGVAWIGAHHAALEIALRLRADYEAIAGSAR